jgi:hypothetical protein
MASAELSRLVEKVVGYPPLSELGDLQRREFHEALLEAAGFEDLPGKWQAANRGSRAEPAEAAHRMSSYCTRGLFPGSRFSSKAEAALVIGAARAGESLIVRREIVVGVLRRVIQVRAHRARYALGGVGMHPAQ